MKRARTLLLPLAVAVLGACGGGITAPDGASARGPRSDNGSNVPMAVPGNGTLGSGYDRSSGGNGTLGSGYDRSSEGNGTLGSGYDRSSEGNGTLGSGY